MAATTPIDSARGMRDWWLRLLLVFQRPKPVFVALRDESGESSSDRSEPVLALILLAGIALVLATGTAGQLMDDSQYDGLLVAVWAFIAGGLSGMLAYFLVGAFVYAAVRLLGSRGSYRRARHVLAFAAAPIALSLVLWPVRLALYGDDVFRTGGSDAGTGARVFELLGAVFLVWSLALLVIGIRAVHGWTWARAAAATAIALGAPAVVAVAFHVR
jgi:hypothetical protein